MKSHCRFRKKQNAVEEADALGEERSILCREGLSGVSGFGFRLQGLGFRV